MGERRKPFGSEPEGLRFEYGLGDVCVSEFGAGQTSLAKITAV